MQGSTKKSDAEKVGSFKFMQSNFPWMKKCDEFID